MNISETAVQTIRDAANLFCSEVENFIANSGNAANTNPSTYALAGQVNILPMTTTEEDTLEAVAIALYGIGATILGADLYARLVALEAALDTYAGE